MSHKLNLRTKLNPAPLGQGNHLGNFMAKRTKLQQMKIDRQHLDHQIKLIELNKQPTNKSTAPKAAAPKTSGRVK